MTKNSRKILIAAIVIVALPLLGLVALPFLLSGDSLRPALLAQLQARLHRRVAAGDIQVKTFPLALRVGDLRIGQAEGIVSQRPFVEAKEVFVAVELWPLLRKDVVIKSVGLKSPRIEIVHSPSGAWSYDTGAESGGQTSDSTSLTLDELTIEDGQVAIDDQRAAKPRDIYEHIDLDLKNFGPNRRASLTGDVRLDRMAAVLTIQSDFETGPAVSAKGTLTLTSARTKDPLNVTFDVRRADARSPVRIQQLEARIGSLSASAGGFVDLEATPPAFELQVKTATAPIADLMRLAALYGATFPADLKIDGNLQADVRITGTTEMPLVAGKIQATKAQITAKELAEPVRASELVLNFTPESATTQPFVIETGATKLTAQATITGYSSEKPRWNATLQTSGARVEELLRIASAYGVKPSGLNGTGGLDLDMKVSQSDKTVSYSGSGALRNVSLTSPDLPKTLTVAAAAIKFSDDRIVLDGLDAGMGSMHWKGSLSLKDFERPDLQFNLHFDQVNVEEVSRMVASPSGQSGAAQTGKAQTDKAKSDKGKTPKGAAKQQPQGVSLNRITAKGTITVDRLLYQQTTLTNLNAKLDLQNGILKLDPVTSGIFGGQETGTVTADLREASTHYNVKVKLTNVDSNQLLSSTSSVKDIVSGPLSGNFDLRFVSNEDQNIASTLNGTAQMQMGPGRISGVQILNELANIGRFLGYTRKQEAYTNINKLSGSLNIHDGVATTNDLLMDLGGGTLTGSGTLGLADQSLKLKVTATLTREYTQKNGFAQAGGLLSTVLSNRRGDLVLPILVSGTFSQPRFAPDAEQMAKLKLSGLFGAGGGSVQGLIETLTGKPPDPNAKPGEKPPQDPMSDLLNQLLKKKDQKKQ